MQNIAPPKEAGCPMWMVSFGDTVSLLVTFFVMMLAFSETDTHKLMNALGAMKGALGISQVPESRGGDAQAVTLKKNQAFPGIARIGKEDLSKQKLASAVFDKQFSRLVVGNTDKSIMLMLLQNGLSLRISAAALFQKGAAEIIPEKKWIMDAMADIVASLDNEIMIVNVLPENVQSLNDPRQTAWNLGMERSWAVREYLLKLGAFTEERCSLGVRIRAADSPKEGAKGFSPEFLEIICVGYYPSRADLPESLLMQ